MPSLGAESGRHTRQDPPRDPSPPPPGAGAATRPPAVLPVPALSDDLNREWARLLALPPAARWIGGAVGAVVLFFLFAYLREWFLGALAVALLYAYRDALREELWPALRELLYQFPTVGRIRWREEWATWTAAIPGGTVVLPAALAAAVWAIVSLLNLLGLLLVFGVLGYVKRDALFRNLTGRTLGPVEPRLTPGPFRRGERVSCGVRFAPAGNAASVEVTAELRAESIETPIDGEALSRAGSLTMVERSVTLGSFAPLRPGGVVDLNGVLSIPMDAPPSRVGLGETLRWTYTLTIKVGGQSAWRCRWPVEVGADAVAPPLLPAHVELEPAAAKLDRPEPAAAEPPPAVAPPTRTAFDRPAPDDARWPSISQPAADRFDPGASPPTPEPAPPAGDGWLSLPTAPATEGPPAEPPAGRPAAAGGGTLVQGRPPDSPAPAALPSDPPEGPTPAAASVAAADMTDGTAVSGAWSYRVCGVERHRTLEWTSLGNALEAKGVFLVVRLELTVVGDRPTDLRPRHFALLLPDGERAAVDERIGMSVALQRLGWPMIGHGVLGMPPPGVPVRAGLAFDVPAEVSNARLWLAESKVELPLPAAPAAEPPAAP